jgi:TonB family protein
VKNIALPAVVLALVLTPGVIAFAQTRSYTPPRLLRAELPAEPGLLVVGGGEVMIEFTVDERGNVTRPTVVRSTPPYTEMVLAAIAQWRFQPARASDDRVPERAVEAPVTVTAVFRPPQFYSGPSLGESPREIGRLSGDVAYPISVTSPPYPPLAYEGGVLLYEVALAENGRLVDARTFASSGGFERAALAALLNTQFRGATHRARPVRSVTYVLFGFRQPNTIGSPRPPSTPPPPGSVPVSR